MADENNSSANWRDALPDALKADPSLASFKDVSSLADSFVKTKALVGASVRPPGPDASAEDKKAFREKMQKAAPELIYAPEGDPEVEKLLYQRLGRPEKPEDYAADEESAKAVNLEYLRKVAATTGLTKSQFAALAKAEAETAKALRSQHQEAHAALDKEWGAATSERIQAAAAAAQKLGLSETAIKAITDRAVPADQLRLLFSVAQAVGGNPREGDRQKDSIKPGAMTPDEAKTAISEIMRNKAHPYWQKGDPAHGAALKRMLDLHAYADPTASREAPSSGA